MIFQDFDLAVIGWGKAGKTVAIKLAKQGKRVALVEASSQMYGGTCINIGCVPTKSLVNSAKNYQLAANQAGDAAAVQNGCSNPRAADEAFRQALHTRNALTAKMNQANFQMAASAGVQIFDGVAHFTGAQEIEISGSDTVRIRARHFIINTGSTPVIPPIAGLVNINSGRIVDSTGVQQLSELPRRLTVLGGGPIGLEFATIFNNFGSEVTVLDTHKAPLARFDADVAEAGAEAGAGTPVCVSPCSGAFGFYMPRTQQRSFVCHGAVTHRAATQQRC